MKHLSEQLYSQILVLRCQARDERAFEELVQAFHVPLVTYITQMLGDTAALEDVLQETWLAVLRGLPSLRSPRAFPLWLHRVARNKVATELRRRGRRFTALDESDPEIPGQEEVDSSPEGEERIRRGLDRLPPAHREVLILRFLQDMSYEEIAGVIGCPVGTVRSRIHYAKRALRSALGE